MNPRSSGSRRLARRSSSFAISRPQIPWRALALPLALVAVVIAASLAAKGQQAPKDVEPRAGTAITLSRTLSCVRDTAPSSVRIGTVPAGSSGLTLPPGRPGRVIFEPKAAASGYATQWATGKGWLAARSCPSPGDDWWFVGAGAGISHRGILTLDNPRSNDANVTIAVYGPNGLVDAPGLSGLLVPAGQSVRIDLEAVAPALGDLSVHVSAIRGLVAASLWEKWAASPVVKPVSAWVPAASAPATLVQLVGVPTKLSHSTLLVTNPGATVAVVRLRAVNAAATFAPAKHPTLTIPPESTYAVGVDDLLKVGAGSIQLSSSIPITAGLRAVRGGAEAYAAPALRIGAQSTIGLPSAAPASLMLAAPTAASVVVTAVDNHGKVVLTRTVVLPGGTAAAIKLPANAAALRLVGDRRSSAVGAVILDGKGIAVLGLVPTATAANVPGVVAQPY